MQRQILVGILLALTACSGATESNPSSPPAGGTFGASGGTSSSAGGAAGTGGDARAAGGDGGAVLSGCDAERARLELDMTQALAAAATNDTITTDPDFTVALEAADGHRFVYSHGDSSLDTVYESASTSKWVAAAVILDLVDQGVLSLDDQPSKWVS